VFGGGDRIAERRVHHHHALGACNRDVDIVDPDPGAALTLDVSLEELSFRDGAGPVLIGLESLHLESAQWDAQSLRARARLVELVNPVARIERRSAGVGVPGLLFKSAAAPAATQQDEPAAAPVGKPVGEQAEHAQDVTLGVDTILADGLDLHYTDTSVTPTVDVWLNGLAADVSGFDTRTGSAAPLLPSDVLLNAGPPESAAPTQGDPPASAGLPAIQELALTGRLQRNPELDGFLRVEVDVLDLPILKGPASASGVLLEGGTLDARVDLRFPGDGSLRSNSRLVFTDLDVTEPADGPISRYLRLPAPLGTVVFVLRNEKGVIDIPLDFSVTKEGMSLTEVTQVAIATLGRLILDAIANSPFRVVGAVGDMAGMVGNLLGADRLFGTGDEPRQLRAVTLDFAAARDDFDAESLAALDALAAQLDDRSLDFRLSHVLGRADRERAEVLANPSTGATLELATRLRRLREAQLRERATLIDAQRAVLAVRMDSQVEPGAARLREVDADLGRTERALDSALERLRPNAERQAGRRTQQACVSIAAARLEAVRVALLARGDEDLPERMRVERARYREPARDGGGQVVISIVPRRLDDQPFYARIWTRLKSMVGLD
jgi:hypothetical protein